MQVAVHAYYAYEGLFYMWTQFPYRGPWYAVCSVGQTLKAQGCAGSLDVLEVLSSSDTFLPVLAAAMADSPASAQADSNDASQQQAEQQPQGHSSTEPAHQQQSQQVSQGSSVLNTAAAQQPQQNSVQKVEGAVMLQNAVALQPQQQNQHGKKLPKQRQQAAEQQQPASWQPQHHMQTRRQLGHQVAQLQQLGNCQQPQQQQLQARLDRQRTPQQWQQQHQDLAQSQQNNQLPRLQQSDQVQDGEPAADHQLQQQSAQGQQSCPDQRPQQQRPHGHQLQDKQQHQQRMHEKQPPHQQHQLQDQQSLIGQEQEAADQQPQVSEQQASNQQQQAADQQQVQQHQRGTLAARPVLHPQAAVRLAAEEASSSQQHQQAQDARRKQGALTMPEHQALIVAVQSLDPGQEKDIQQQQPLPLQLEPSEAELRVPEPVSQRRQPASGAGLQSSQQTAAQTLTLQQQLGVHTVMPSSEALAREDIRPSPDPEIQVLSEGQGQTLRLVEGQLPANLEQCQTD